MLLPVSLDISHPDIYVGTRSARLSRATGTVTCASTPRGRRNVNKTLCLFTPLEGGTTITEGESRTARYAPPPLRADLTRKSSMLSTLFVDDGVSVSISVSVGVGAGHGCGCR